MKIEPLAGKLALVTGATGLVGGRICRRLLREGMRVRAVDRRPTDSTGVDSVVADVPARQQRLRLPIDARHATRVGNADRARVNEHAKPCLGHARPLGPQYRHPDGEGREGGAADRVVEGLDAERRLDRPRAHFLDASPERPHLLHRGREEHARSRRDFVRPRTIEHLSPQHGNTPLLPANHLGGGRSDHGPGRGPRPVAGSDGGNAPDLRGTRSGGALSSGPGPGHRGPRDQPQLPDAAPQRVPRDAKYGGGARDVAAVLLEDGPEVITNQVIE